MPNPLGYIDDIAEYATRSRPDLIPDITPGRPPLPISPQPRPTAPVNRTPSGGNPNRNPTRPRVNGENWPSGDPVADRQFLDDYDARQREQAYQEATRRIDEEHTQDLVDQIVDQVDSQNAGRQIAANAGLTALEIAGAAARNPALRGVATGLGLVGAAEASYAGGRAYGEVMRRVLARVAPYGEEWYLYPEERHREVIRDSQSRIGADVPESTIRRGQGLVSGVRYDIPIWIRWRAPSGAILEGEDGNAGQFNAYGPIVDYWVEEDSGSWRAYVTHHDEFGNLKTSEQANRSKTAGFQVLDYVWIAIRRLDGTEEPGWTDPPETEPTEDDDDFIDRLRDIAGGTPPQRHRPDREPDTYGPDGIAEPRLPSGPDPLIGLPGIGLPGIGYPGIEPSLEPSVEPTQLPGGYGTPYPSVGIPGGQPGSGGRDRRTGGGSESQPTTYTPDGTEPATEPQPQPQPRNPLDPENFIDDDCCGSSGQREILRRLEDVMNALKLNPGLIDLTNCDGSGSVVATLDNFADKVTAIETALSHLNGNTKCPPTLAIPESFEAKAPKIRSQCVIQWKKKDSSASSRWSLTIPHFNEGFKDSINLPAYRKGNWVCTLQLENNSHVIVNAFDKGEGQKVLQACLGYIESQYANNPIFKYTEKTGNLSQVEVEPVYASFFADGDRKQPAKWGRRL